MIIILKKGINPSEIEILKDDFGKYNCNVNVIETNCDQKIMVLNGDTKAIDDHNIMSNPLITKAIRISTPYKLVSREYKASDTLVKVGDTLIGGKDLVIIAGPCSVESEEQIDRIAKLVKESGAHILRGGAYKPRKSPYYFQGLKEEGIKYLVNAKNKYHMPIITEITTLENLDQYKDVDIIQVGARNMQNYELLKGLGKINKPILLKRGMSNTIEELLLSAEYIASNGNPNIILCERGIRTIETATRNTLDLSSVSLLIKLTHLPVICDPSHATGNWELVEPMSLASICSGADGLIIEVHDDPSNAYSDGDQSIKVERLKEIIEKGRKISNVIGRDIK